MSINYKECATYYDRMILQSKCNVEDDCSVCLESLLNKKVIYLPCKHYFHSACLNMMIKAKTYTCPLCRYNLINSLHQIGHNFYTNVYGNANANANGNTYNNNWDDLFFNILMDYEGAFGPMENEVDMAGAAADMASASEAAGAAGAAASEAAAGAASAAGGAAVAGATGAANTSIIRAYLIYYTS
jgi:hypothetical protein